MMRPPGRAAHTRRLRPEPSVPGARHCDLMSKSGAATSMPGSSTVAADAGTSLGPWAAPPARRRSTRVVTLRRSRAAGWPARLGRPAVRRARTDDMPRPQQPAPALRSPSMSGRPRRADVPPRTRVAVRPARSVERSSHAVLSCGVTPPAPSVAGQSPQSLRWLGKSPPQGGLLSFTSHLACGFPLARRGRCQAVEPQRVLVEGFA